MERLIEDIQNGLNLLPYCPIIVYEDEDKLRIVDGQHRFTTSKELGFPVYYVICEKLDLRKIARMNSRSDKWKNRDFLECYIRLGVKDYEVLFEFIHEYDIIYSAAVNLLMYGKMKGPKNSMDQFRDGEFEVHYRKKQKKSLRLPEICLISTLSGMTGI